MPNQDAKPLIFCIPVFNDWESVKLLVERIDKLALPCKYEASVLLVDDGSTDKPLLALPTPPQSLKKVEILSLRCNVGHQRAIALGLSYIYSERPCRAIVVMDGDGEDSPEDVVALLERFEACNGERVIFAKRSRRAESWMFCVFYWIYKVVHWILTGRRVEVGNFSVLPASLLSRLVGISELWNHYAAAVFKARLPRNLIPIPRARRLQGRSKMNFVALVTHGLSAMSVFGEEIGVRLLVTSGILMLFTLVGLIVVICIKLFTQMAIAGWATSAAGILFTVLINAEVLSLAYCFIILQSRNNAAFLPLRDYTYYIMDVIEIAVND